MTEKGIEEIELPKGLEKEFNELDKTEELEKQSVLSRIEIDKNIIKENDDVILVSQEDLHIISSNSENNSFLYD